MPSPSSKQPQELSGTLTVLPGHAFLSHHLQSCYQTRLWGAAGIDAHHLLAQIFPCSSVSTMQS